MRRISDLFGEGLEPGGSVLEGSYEDPSLLRLIHEAEGISIMGFWTAGSHPYFIILSAQLRVLLEVRIWEATFLAPGGALFAQDEQDCGLETALVVSGSPLVRAGVAL